jgi:hypothetical protein
MAILVTRPFGCGIRKTLDEFAALQKSGGLGTRELEPAKP